MKKVRFLTKLMEGLEKQKPELACATDLESLLSLVPESQDTAATPRGEETRILLLIFQLPCHPQGWWSEGECSVHPATAKLMTVNPPAPTTAAREWFLPPLCLPHLIQMLLAGRPNLCSEPCWQGSLGMLLLSFSPCISGESMEGCGNDAKGQ